MAEEKAAPLSEADKKKHVAASLAILKTLGAANKLTKAAKAEVKKVGSAVDEVDGEKG